MFLIESSSDLSIKTAELITEKISMPSVGLHLARPRLRVMLNRGLESCTSTIICGRSGAGKSTLALDFARRCGRRVAWYKVDAPEADIEIFFRYLIASIRKELPHFGVDTLTPLLRSARDDRAQLLAEAFVYELVEGEGKPLLIVIEDLHLVCDSEWLVPFFRRLLPLLPGEVHMLITSRTMLPAPLWRMRSKQTLCVIEEEELAFTRQEAIELFESYGLSSEQATIALDHTHGRVSSLVQIATTLMEKQEFGSLRASCGL